MILPIYKSFIRNLFVLIFVGAIFIFLLPGSSHAATKQSHVIPLLLAQGIGAGQAPVASDGAWLTDPDVTFAGKTASRSATLFNWVLVNYKWDYDPGDNTLIQFWVKIRNIVYAFLVLIVIITAFTMIITGGKGITAIQFLRKFLIVVFLITLSFAFIRFFYQIVDIITGFFVRNPDGAIISSKDLFNMSFGYENFIGWRRYGPEFDESAFVSLLLVKITAVTYYVMAGILIVRKIILWFFITVSPIYPILLLYFPIRNTAKIWLGEFFRWLLYMPLFTIFLSGLVYLYRQDINVMNFDFTGVGSRIVYPTAINILLGGPGQKLDITNSVNYNDTFAEYIIALIMVWVVIFLPFLLLRIFLDYMSNISINKDTATGYVNNALGYIVNRDKLFINNHPSNAPIGPKTPPSLQPAGVARPIPFSSGSAREVIYNQGSIANASHAASKTLNTAHSAYNRTSLPQANVFSQSRSTARLKTASSSMTTLQMANVPIPSMRDIAKYETERLTTHDTNHMETSKVQSTLEKIANPYAVTSTIEREHFTQVREKLFQAKLQGDQIASSILNAANNITTSHQDVLTTTTNQTSVIQKNLNETLQKLGNPASITSEKERQQFTQVRESLERESKQGNILATTLLSASRNVPTQSQSSTSTDSNLQQTIEKIANVESLATTAEKQKYASLKQQLVKESKDGNPVATTVLNAVKNVEASRKASKITTKTAAITSLPAVNQVQTVNLDDYENVKKMWTENYKKIAVPKTLDKSSRTREEWIKEDLGNINQAISLLISGDQQKVNQGMSIVSNILPFLLMGGFSQTEVIAYLKAKEVAGEDVLKEMVANAQKEADSQAFVSATRRKSTRHAAMSQTAAVSMDELNENEAEDTSGNPEQINQILKLVNFHLPTIRDIVNYESRVSADKSIYEEVNQVQQTLQKIATPENIANPAERDRYTKIKTELQQAKDKGDQIAGSILTAAANLSTTQGLHNMSTMHLIAAPVSLPQVNTVQTVNLDDYENVKKMWMENYQRMEIPKTIDNPNRTREEWILGDLAKVNQAISLLISGDEQQIKQGMSLVSNILPFLLIGGFSQPEVVAYLKAKQVAGEDVLKDMKEQTTKEAETETFVTAGKRNHHTTASQTATVAMNEVSPEEEDTERSVIAPTQQLKINQEKINEILGMVNFKIPNISDVVSYELSPLTTDETIKTDLQNIQSLLQNIADPSKISDMQTREQFTKIREALLKEKETGDHMASSVLAAAENSVITMQNIRDNRVQTVPIIYQDLNQMLQRLANPQSISDDMEKQRFSTLRDELIQNSKEGDPIASAILQVSPISVTSPIDPSLMSVLQKLAMISTIANPAEKEQFEKIHQKLIDEDKKGNVVASTILKTANALAKPQENGLPVAELPKENEIQTINLDDYENVKTMWLNMYLHATVPNTLDKSTRTREEWIRDDLTTIYQTINLLISGNKDQMQQGMGFVHSILPFLLMGGFSESEVVAYLKAKQVAAEKALNTFTQEQKQEQEEQETVLPVLNNQLEKATTESAAMMEAPAEQTAQEENTGEDVVN